MPQRGITMASDIAPHTESSSTTKSSIRSGLRTASRPPVGLSWARRAPKRSAWPSSRKSGLTCVPRVSGSRWKKSGDIMTCHDMKCGEWISLVDLLRRRAQEEPRQTFLPFSPMARTRPATLTRGELDRRACAIAARLQALGPDSSVRVRCFFTRPGSSSSRRSSAAFMPESSPFLLISHV